MGGLPQRKEAATPCPSSCCCTRLDLGFFFKANPEIQILKLSILIYEH